MKFRTLLAALLLALVGIQASADTNRYLTFTMGDGLEVSYQLEGLSLTFAGSTLNISATDTKVSYPTASLRNMFFSATPTAISATKTAQQTFVTVNGNKLTITAPAGTNACVYDVQGRLVVSATIDRQGTPVSVNTNLPGIYSVRVGNKTVKVLSK